MKYTCHKGKRYAARISLGVFEQFASNDLIVKKFQDAGFHDVNVHGEGAERIAHGTWTGDDASAEMPSQITEVKEITV